MSEVKFLGKLFVMAMKKDAKLEEELTCSLKIDMRNLTNLTRALESLKYLHFNGLFLIKVYNVCAKEVQRSYIWWHWRLMQNLKENWFVLSKMSWRIWQVFVHMLKNCNFILESKMAELNQKFKTTRSTRCSVKTLFYLGNEWIAQLTKLFTDVLQNRCS